MPTSPDPGPPPLVPLGAYPLPAPGSTRASAPPAPSAPSAPPAAPPVEGPVVAAAKRRRAAQNMVAIDFGTSSTTVAVARDLPGHQRGFAGPRRDELLTALDTLMTERPDVHAPARAVLLADRRGGSLRDALSPVSIVTSQLDDLMASLERFAGNRADPDLWVALGECYKAFFGARPFETLGIWPLELAIAGGRPELSSAVGAIAAAPPSRPGRRVLVGAEYESKLDDLAAFPEPRGTSPDELRTFEVHRGLKRQIGTGDGADAEALVVELLRRLKTEVEEQFQSDGRFGTTSREPLALRRAVLTYPTVAHPGRRKRLQALAHLAGIEDVVGSYDEAVAAAIAHLAKSMQSNFEIGFEAFLSRCRPLGVNRWEHTVLVVDVGGGTTDVALLGIEIHDRTADQLSEGDDEGSWGRLYRITPTVLGSTGAMFQGGDRLTLDVFRYRKAVDALEKGDIAPLRDAVDYVQRLGRVEDRHRPEYLQLVRDVDAAVTTRWADVPDPDESLARRAEFYRRWNEAEQVKLDHAGRRFRGDADERWFLDRIVGDFAKEVASTAASVVRRAFGQDTDQDATPDGEGSAESTTADPEAITDDPDGHVPRPRIDAVVLSGKSSGFPAVKEHLVEELRQFGVDASRVEGYGDDVAKKQAASLGACYAQHLDEKGFGAPRTSLRQGAWQLDLAVQNLRFNLPAPFGVTLQRGNQLEHHWVFGHADRREFRPLDARHAADGSGHVRSEWMPTQPSIHLHRASKEPIPWGSWDLRYMVGKERYPALAERLVCQFEIDLELSVHLYLATDRPAFDMTRVEPAESLGRPLTGADDRVLVPSVAVVVGQSTGAYNEKPVTVAEPGRRFEHTVFTGADDDLRDALLIELEPEAHSVTRNGELKLSFGFPGEEPRRVVGRTPPSPPVADRQRAVDERYQPLAHLVLVDDGRVYYVPGAPPYWVTDTPDGLTTPGRVWRVEAEPPPDEPELGLHDPFNGTH